MTVPAEQTAQVPNTPPAEPTAPVATQPPVQSGTQEPVQTATNDAAQEENAREIDEKDINQLLEAETEEVVEQPADAPVETPVVTAPAAPAPVTPPAATTPPAPAPQTDAAKAAAAAAEAAKPQQPAAPAPAAEPIPQPKSMEELQTTFNKWRDDAEVLLATEHYGKVLTPEHVKALEEEGAGPKTIEFFKSVPRLMAKVYMDSIQAAMGQVVTHLPQLITATMKQQTTINESETKFFGRWPALADQGHRDTVMRIAKGYRQSHPNATEAQFVEEVGAMATIALRLPLNVQAQPQPGAIPPVAAPFRPASAAGRPAAAPVQQSNNPFEQLAREDMIEDVNG